MARSCNIPKPNVHKYSIRYRGKWLTVNGCNGPVQAYLDLTQEKLIHTKIIDRYSTRVNGNLVMEVL